MADSKQSRVHFWLGLVCLAAGGLLLALGGESATYVGTTAGLAGVALLGWAWARR